MSDSPILSGADILGANDITEKLLPVDVPEWGGTVLIRKLPCTDRDAFILKAKDKDVKPTATLAWLLTRALVDKDGVLLFGTADAAKLASKSGEVVERVGSQVIKHNKLTGEEDAKAVGEPDAA